MNTTDKHCRTSRLISTAQTRRKWNLKMKTLLFSALMFSTAILGVAPAMAQGALPAKTIKNIVLVHGAFVDETSWDGVAAILTAKGYKVTAVKNPLTSLADDVAATNAVLDAQNGPTVLVGHSWGVW
jgi:pimeloyl-ACP methyl ester carboxylesterase